MSDDKDLRIAELELKVRDAERLADEVDALIGHRVIDSRSPAADALLDFRNPPRTDRSDRIAELEGVIALFWRALKMAPSVSAHWDRSSAEPWPTAQETYTFSSRDLWRVREAMVGRKTAAHWTLPEPEWIDLPLDGWPVGVTVSAMKPVHFEIRYDDGTRVRIRGKGAEEHVAIIDAALSAATNRWSYVPRPSERFEVTGPLAEMLKKAKGA